MTTLPQRMAGTFTIGILFFGIVWILLISPALNLERVRSDAVGLEARLAEQSDLAHEALQLRTRLRDLKLAASGAYGGAPRRPSTSAVTEAVAAVGGEIQGLVSEDVGEERTFFDFSARFVIPADNLETVLSALEFGAQPMILQRLTATRGSGEPGPGEMLLVELSGSILQSGGDGDGE